MSCVEWTKARDRQGYGVVWHEGKKIFAHRMEWSKANGPIPSGMCVLHKCDNPGCINVKHLFLGTRTENNKDRVAKKRSADVSGEKHPASKLTETQVLAIRTDRRIQRAIAAEYGVDPSTISNIKRRRNWAHI